MRRGAIPAFCAAAAVLFALTAGCAPTRQEYYAHLRRARLEAYRDWQEGRDEERSLRVDGNLDLDSAVRLGLKRNTQLLATLQEKERARGGVIEAYSELLPDLTFSSSYTRLDQPIVPGGSKDIYSYSFLVTQPLFRGRAFIAQRAAKLATFFSDETVRSAVESVVFDVAQAYFDSLLAEHLVGVQEISLEATLAHMQSVEQRKEQGVATEYDVLRARVEVSNVQAVLIAERNARDVARTRLYRAMGVSQRSQAHLTTPLSYVEGAPSFEEAVRIAFVNRPDIYLANMDVDIQREIVNDAYMGYLPTVDASYLALWSRPDPNNPANAHWDNTWQAGVQLDWTLFDGLSREGRIIQEKAVLRQRAILLMDAEQGAIQQIESALKGMRNAQELVETQKLNRERAKRALELVEEGYKVGVNTEIEMLDARSALTTAAGLYYTALHRHTIARVGLQRALGLLGPAPGADKVPESVVSPGDLNKAVKEESERIESTP